MIVVDAGVLLSGIIEALRDCESEDGVLTSGAFVGLQLPHQSPEANGAYIFKKIIGTALAFALDNCWVCHVLFSSHECSECVQLLNQMSRTEVTKEVEVIDSIGK